MTASHRLVLALAGACALLPIQAQAPPITAPSEALLARVDAKDREAVRAFYQKTVTIQGLPVLAAGTVADEALLRTHEIVSHILAGRPDIIQTMVKVGTRLLIIGKDQVYTDLPEYRATPDPQFWNERVRGTGGDDVTSFGEENLLNLANDRYDDMSVGVHEFAHTIDAILTRMDPSWQKELRACFRNVQQRHLYAGAYASSDPAEYWAEGVTMYFDCERPNNWNHGPIVTREGLRRYDPGLYALVKKTLRLSPAQDWKLKPLRPQPSVTAPPANLKADPAYVKFTLAREFPVLGTAKVSDAALLKANDTVRKLFAYRHDLLKALINQGLRLVVLGRDERLSELPEFRHAAQDTAFDELRYLDFTPGGKLLAVPEANVLGLPGDPFQGEAMTISVFAKAVHLALGQRPVDPVFESRTKDRQQYELRVRRLDLRFDRALNQAFAQAARKGLWRGTSQARSASEYWVGGVTAYFDAAGEGQPPLGTQPITTREALKAYDPALFRLVAQTFAYGEHVDWRFRASAASPR